MLISGCSHEGYVILGSGMAVHSFASIEEIRNAPTEEEREATRAKVLAESRTFDTHLRAAVTKRNAEERKNALLKLEELYEFKRSHLTVEVRTGVSTKHYYALFYGPSQLTSHQHFTPLLVAAGAAGDVTVEPLGEDIVEPGMSYLNLRFA
jgi:aromatic ring-opening dioxygenase catalytic subunit (LigB family)